MNIPTGYIQSIPAAERAAVRSECAHRRHTWYEWYTSLSISQRALHYKSCDNRNSKGKDPDHRKGNYTGSMLKYIKADVRAAKENN